MTVFLRCLKAATTLMCRGARVPLYGQVDFWTLGILLYEMIGGLPPFYSENTNEMYQRVRACLPAWLLSTIRDLARLIAG